MVSINPADNTGTTKDSGIKNFRQQMDVTKEYLNSIYASGGEGNDSTKIDTQLEAFSLDNYLNSLKEFYNKIKEKVTPAEAQELQKLIQEQEDVLENYTNENKLTNISESEWHTPTKGSHTQGTVMRTVRNDDGSYYEEYKNPDTGRTYISYDAKGNRTGGSWNTIINGTEYPTRKEWTDSEGNYRAVNIVYDEQGNVLKEYGDDEDYEPIQREIKK